MQLEHSQRPWGEYFVLYNGDVCKVKKIVVNPRQRLSYQTHAKRKEHWTIVQGEGTVTLNGKVLKVSAGQSIDIGLGDAHRIENQGSEPVIFIEVQMGSYFGEDDIVRLSDDYGRSEIKP